LATTQILKTLVQVDGADKAAIQLDRFKSKLTGLNTAANENNAKPGGILGFITSKATVITAGITAIAAGLGKLGEAAIEAYEKKAQLDRAFSAAGFGSGVTEKLRDLSRDLLIPFEDLSKLTLQLSAAGFKDIEGTIKTIANVANSSVNKQGVLSTLSELVAEGNVGEFSFGKVERLLEFGINGFEILQTKLGKSNSQLKEMAQTAQGAQQLTQALITGLQEKYAQGTINALDSISGKWEQFKKELQLETILESIGGFLSSILKAILEIATEWVRKIKDAIREISDAFSVISAVFDAVIHNLKVAWQEFTTFLGKSIRDSINATTDIINRYYKAINLPIQIGKIEEPSATDKLERRSISKVIDDTRTRLAQERHRELELEHGAPSPLTNKNTPRPLRKDPPKASGDKGENRLQQLERETQETIRLYNAAKTGSEAVYVATQNQIKAEEILRALKDKGIKTDPEHVYNLVSQQQAYNEKLKETQKLLEHNKHMSKSFSDGLAEGMRNLAEQSSDFNMGIKTVDTIADSFRSLSDAIFDADFDFAAWARNFAKRLANIALEILVIAPIMNMMKSWFNPTGADAGGIGGGLFGLLGKGISSLGSLLGGSNAASAVPSTWASGGLVQSFAIGGSVKGFASGGMRDRIPSMLEPGEFVIRRSSVNAIGAANLQRMNQTGKQSMPPVQVRIENNGTGKEITDSQMSFDGDKYILSVVQKDIENNGGLRKTIRSMR
jgi:hypothetical protein